MLDDFTPNRDNPSLMGIHHDVEQRKHKLHFRVSVMGKWEIEYYDEGESGFMPFLPSRLIRFILSMKANHTQPSTSTIQLQTKL